MRTWGGDIVNWKRVGIGAGIVSLFSLGGYAGYRLLTAEQPPPPPPPPPPGECTEGNTKLKQCWDGSYIVTHRCLNGHWEETTEKCPPGYDCTGTSRGTSSCKQPSGKVWFGYCKAKYWTPAGEPCEGLQPGDPEIAVFVPMFDNHVVYVFNQSIVNRGTSYFIKIYVVWKDDRNPTKCFITYYYESPQGMVYTYANADTLQNLIANHFTPLRDDGKISQTQYDNVVAQLNEVFAVLEGYN